MFKNWKIVFLLLMFLSLLPVIAIIQSCKAIEHPYEPVQYWAKVEVIYDRDPAKIRFSQGNDAFTLIRYELFDPDCKIKSKYDGEIIGYYRVGSAPMEKIAENKFRGYIEQVFVQTESWHGKHRIYIRDAKLYDGMSSVSTYTPDGITIQHAYDIHIFSYQLHFKTSKQ